MAKFIQGLNVDLVTNQYVVVNASQNDIYSRYFDVKITLDGQVTELDPYSDAVYVKCTPEDGRSFVMDDCEIITDSNDEYTIVRVRVSDYACTRPGVITCYLMVVRTGSDGSETTGIESFIVIHSMSFIIKIHETAFNSSNIESNSEYIGLETTLASYSENLASAANSLKTAKAAASTASAQATLAKGYADTVYSNVSKAADSADDAATSATNASKYEEAASIIAFGTLDKTFTVDEDNVEVTSDDTTIASSTENALYYKNLASLWATGDGKISDSNYSGAAGNNYSSRYWAEKAQAAAQTVTDTLSDNSLNGYSIVNIPYSDGTTQTQTMTSLFFGDGTFDITSSEIERIVYYFNK